MDNQQLDVSLSSASIHGLIIHLSLGSSLGRAFIDQIFDDRKVPTSGCTSQRTELLPAQPTQKIVATPFSVWTSTTRFMAHAHSILYSQFRIYVGSAAQQVFHDRKVAVERGDV